MYNSSLFSYLPNIETHHKVFLSYYHAEDQAYKDAFANSFDHLFINKSVEAGDITSDVAADYIRHLIQSTEYLGDASVCVVLCGKNTKTRKHVDWEISGALDKRVNGRSGLVGILLPSFPLTPDGNYHYDNLPTRLADNVKTGFASIYRWDYITQNDITVKQEIDRAFNKRNNDSIVVNNRQQMQNNLPINYGYY